MSDAHIIAMAVLAFAAALLPVPVPWPPVAVLVVVLYLAQRPVPFLLAVAVLVSALSSASWAGLRPVDVGPFVDAQAQLVTDPLRVERGTVAVVRIDGRRYQAWAWGGAGFRLSQTLAGHQVRLTGRASPYGGSNERRAALHIGHQISVESITRDTDGGPMWRLANGFRTLVAGGADGLGTERRALFTGVVFGDDREQSDAVANDFRAVGLTHLLAVSGQNVAFVLAVARPALQRLTLRGRWAATLALLVLFAFVTRFEPSVLRATMMAGLAATSGLLGRPASVLRLLALAVTVLLVVDPLLAETVAFRLSVAASLGIVVGAERLAQRLSGPLWWRNALGVTVAAQLAVAPILVATFGSISVVSVPANILAGPAAGPLMMWGLTGGVVAGILGGPVASALHLPTLVLLWWLETVARVGAAVPVGSMGFRGLLLGGGVALLATFVGRARNLRRDVPVVGAEV